MSRYANISRYADMLIRDPNFVCSKHIHPFLTEKKGSSILGLESQRVSNSRTGFDPKNHLKNPWKHHLDNISKFKTHPPHSFMSLTQCLIVQIRPHIFKKKI